MRTINRNWLWVIGGMMLLNIALLTFIWVEKPERNPPPFLEEKLKFSQNQHKQFESLKNEHRSKMEGIKTDIERLKDKLYGNFSSTDFTDEEARKLAKQIGQKKAESDFLTYQHFQEVREICTREQQQEFDKLISDLVRSMDGPKPPRGSRPEGRREGPPEGRMPPPR
jgi:hypothetical protein